MHTLRHIKSRTTLPLVALLSTVAPVAHALEYELMEEIPFITNAAAVDQCNYIGAVFAILIGIAGALAVIVIVVGAIQFILGAGNASKRSAGKERMLGAGLGLLIAIVAWIVLNTINEDLVRGCLTVTSTPTANTAPYIPPPPADEPPNIAVSSEVIELVEGDPMPDFLAGVSATDAIDGARPVVVQDNGGFVNTASPGSYIVTYYSEDSDGNSVVTQRVYTVLSTAVAAGALFPTINLIGQAVIEVQLNQFPVNDPGVVANDPQDGVCADPTTPCTLTFAYLPAIVDPTTPGDYTVVYTATDSDGNAVSASRIFRVLPDTTPPEITLWGYYGPAGFTTDIEIELGRPYGEPGYGATDDIDGNITPQVVSVGAVDNMTLGTYTITYTVTDSSGNTTVETRLVTVKDFDVDYTSDCSYMQSCLGNQALGSCAAADLDGSGEITQNDYNLFDYIVDSFDLNDDDTIELGLGSAVNSCFIKINRDPFPGSRPCVYNCNLNYICNGDDCVLSPYEPSLTTATQYNPAMECAKDVVPDFVFTAANWSSIDSRLDDIGTNPDSVALRMAYWEFVCDGFYPYDWSCEWDDAIDCTVETTNCGTFSAVSTLERIVYTTLADMDVDANKVTGLSADELRTSSCVGDPIAGSCARADMNWDGVITDQDTGAFGMLSFIESELPISVAEAEQISFDPTLYTDARIVSYCVGARASGSCAAADLNSDGVVDATDVAFFTSQATRVDFNGDGVATTICY